MSIASVKGKFNWSAQTYTALDSGWCLKKSTAVITGFSTLGYQMPPEPKSSFVTSTCTQTFLQVSEN